MTFLGGAAPKAEDFLKQMASLVVQKNLGITDGKGFRVLARAAATPRGRGAPGGATGGGASSAPARR